LSATGGGTNTSFPFYFTSAYVYGSFLNKVLYTQAGLVDYRGAATGGNLGATYTKETAGAVLVVRPVDGLEFNVFVGPASHNSVSGTALANPANLYSLPHHQTDLDNAVSSMGVVYTVPNVVKLVGQVKAQNPNVDYGTYLSKTAKPPP